MIIAKETTNWSGIPSSKNNTYLLSDQMDQMYGYWDFEDNTFKQIKSESIPFDPRNRTFNTLFINISNLSKKVA